MDDRITTGFIVGLVGGVLMSIVNTISYYLGITELLYLDWAAVMIFGYRATTLVENVISQGGQLFFSGLVGSIFVMLIPLIKSKNLYFKGWLFSMLVWFGSYALMSILEVTPLIPIGADTVLSNIVTASFYGLVLAYGTKRLFRNNI